MIHSGLDVAVVRRGGRGRQNAPSYSLKWHIYAKLLFIYWHEQTKLCIIFRHFSQWMNDWGGGQLSLLGTGLRSGGLSVWSPGQTKHGGCPGSRGRSRTPSEQCWGTLEQGTKPTNAHICRALWWTGESSRGGLPSPIVPPPSLWPPKGINWLRRWDENEWIKPTVLKWEGCRFCWTCDPLTFSQ